jgi:hypothetical protein
MWYVCDERVFLAANIVEKIADFADGRNCQCEGGQIFNSAYSRTLADC